VLFTIRSLGIQTGTPQNDSGGCRRRKRSIVPAPEQLEGRALLASIVAVDPVIGAITIGAAGEQQSAEVSKDPGYQTLSIGDPSQSMGTYYNTGGFFFTPGTGGDSPIAGTADSANYVLAVESYWSDSVYETQTKQLEDLPFSASGGTGPLGNGAPLTFEVLPSAGEQPGDKAVVALQGGDYPNPGVVSYIGSYFSGSSAGSVLSSQPIKFDTAVGQTFQISLALNASGTLGSGDGTLGNGAVFDIGVEIALEPEISASSLDPLVKSGDGALSFSYTVSISSVVDDTKISFYWATGETLDDRITSVDPLVYPIDEDSQKSLGVHTAQFSPSEFAGFLNEKPKDATHLIMVVDPDNTISPADPRARSRPSLCQTSLRRSRPGTIRMVGSTTATRSAKPT